MKKIISMLLCCAMLGTLCACQHGGDLEKRTPVPQFDIMASYSFDDAELKNDDGVSYYRQSLGSAEISSKDERTAHKRVPGRALRQIQSRRRVYTPRCRGSARGRDDRAELPLYAEHNSLRYQRAERCFRYFAGCRRTARRFHAGQPQLQCRHRRAAHACRSCAKRGSAQDLYEKLCNRPCRRRSV